MALKLRLNGAIELEVDWVIVVVVVVDGVTEEVSVAVDGSIKE
jgi:hypothetical protein